MDNIGPKLKNDHRAILDQLETNTRRLFGTATDAVAGVLADGKWHSKAEIADETSRCTLTISRELEKLKAARAIEEARFVGVKCLAWRLIRKAKVKK